MSSRTAEYPRPDHYILHISDTHVLAGLGLLEGQDVDVVPLQEGLDAVDPAAEGVHVPGRDAHPPTLCVARDRSAD